MYDVAVLGAGPAGIAAAIYSARYRMKTLLVSSELGGWAAKAHRIENVPGFASILGKEFKQRLAEQIRANDIDYRQEKVLAIEPGNPFTVQAESGTHQARYVIFALGTRKRKLNVPGEDEFLGKGVCLCATCDAPFFKNKRVAVIGGNDSGTTSALLIAEYASKVYIVEMLEKLPTEPVWLEKIHKEPKIEVIAGDSVSEILGKAVVSSVMLKSGLSLDVEGVFIEIGSVPDIGLLKGMGIRTDRWGNIEVDRAQQTSIDRLYAAGDITNGSNFMRQIVAAEAEGAIAAQAIYKRKQVNEYETQ